MTTTTTQLVNAGTTRDAATVTPKRSIRLFGTGVRHLPRTESRAHGPALKSYDRTFAVGDRAIYDSWNVHYVGTIVAIGAKTVTIKKSGERCNARLNLAKFAFHNAWRSVEEAKRIDADWMD